MIIAVDGPTASGKGTIARGLAAHYGLPYLDTGLLYRAVGRQVFLDGGDPDEAGDALAGAAFPDAFSLIRRCAARRRAASPAGCRSIPRSGRRFTSGSASSPSSPAERCSTAVTSPPSSRPTPR